MARDLLSKYNEKRDFGITAEPPGKAGKAASKDLRFVIQLHEATRTHYDFRLEWDGVMKSWAVTKGPSYNPSDKRLAVRTEDHPIDYNDFEGVIPEKQYGAGPVMIWDEGVWHPEYDPEKMEKKGHITFTIEGTRMKGQWHLVRMKTPDKRENWLLIKGSDDLVMDAGKSESFLKKEMSSVISGRSMKDIRAAGVGKTGVRKKEAVPKKAKASSKKSKPAVSMASLLKKYGAPELATLVERPPATTDWVHEIKYDGYRLTAFIAGGEVVLRTRGMKDWTHKFEPLAKALAVLDAESAVLDLEACVVDAKGRTDFSSLQQALSDERPEKIEGYVFDLLYLDGEDYCKRSLLERKEALAGLLKGVPPPIHYSDHFDSAPDILGKACKIGAEGLVSKRKDSTYQGKRTKDWVKSKCGLAQEFVIGGFMPAKDEPKAVGALLLGYYKDKKFLYAGKVGTGFTRKTAKDVYKKLITLQNDKNPFPEKPPRGLRSYVFLKPEILCEISFAEWTADGHVRHGVFKGLREDKNPKAVTEEVAKPLEDVEPKKAAKTKTKSKAAKEGTAFEGVTITHPERVVYPENDISKGEIAAYYAKVSPLMMPYLKGRLISLLRCTDGIGGQCFFQRNPMKGMGDRIKSMDVTHNGNAHEYLYIEDAKGLLQLVQMGTIEFHGWQSAAKKLNLANQIVFDLDPSDDVPFEAVALAAQDIRVRLKKLGLESFPRLSGGKGVHVVVPIKPEHDWDEVKPWVRAFAEKMQADAPDAYVANMSKKKRGGKIFIDFFRNDFSATAIVPFSLRARDGAGLAWPLSWADLKKVKSASAFRMDQIKDADLKRAEKAGNEFFAVSQRLKI